MLQTPTWILYNIFLASIPVLLGYALAAWLNRKRSKRGWTPLFVLVTVLLTAAWLAFLPNTCYLLTEWRHYIFSPAMADLRAAADTNRSRLHFASFGLFYVIYSGVGVLCFALAIRPVDRALSRRPVPKPLLAIPFFLLLSLGVYMGLIVRLNSWDLVLRPGLVWATWMHAAETPALLRAILIFAFLLWLLYLVVDIWIDGVELRLRKRRSGR